MRIYHDWEFLETGNSVYPISVGMVREDGKELYLEFANAPWTDILKHPWLKSNVIPQLDSKTNAAIVTGEGTAVFKSPLAIRNKVHEFLADAAKQSPKGIELWGWYSAYDHVCLGQLFGAMVNLPGFVPMWTNDIRQETFRLGNVKIPDLRLPGEKAHNAVDDARVEMRMHQWLMDYEINLGVKINRSRGVQYGSGNVQYNTF